MAEREIGEFGNIRTASSEWRNPLLGDTGRYQRILTAEAELLKQKYPDPILGEVFDKMESRIISLAPMVLLDATLKDLGVEVKDEVLAGLGLVMYAVSTHDDVVDERPQDRSKLAGLVYGGDITTIEGMRLLAHHAPREMVDTVVRFMNLTNLAQTQIVEKLWIEPAGEDAYLDAINTTRYWAETGVQAAISYAKRPDLFDFADEFSIYYGKTCQIFDDVREIEDDIKNGYWSLPISLALKNGWDINTPDGCNMAIVRSRELARDYIEKAEKLCGGEFPSLGKLVNQLNVGFEITY
jgi:hypothetical protein